MKINFKVSIILPLLFWYFTGLSAAIVRNKIVENDSLLVAKVFPMLNMIEHDTHLIALLKKEKSLRQIQNNQILRIQQGIRSCPDVNCYADALKWTDADLKKGGDALVDLYIKNTDFQKKVAGLKKAGSYSLFDKLPDTTYIRKAWNQDSKGLNRIFSVYIKGEKPQYIKIDSISFKTGDPDFKARVVAVLNTANNNGTFLSFSLQAAISILKINGRQEMIQYEPLNSGLNAEPYARIKKINWSSYTYSVILVPGLGPETPGLRLDPNGAKRCDEAVKRYKDGLAPFIVVSGGNVHPFRTPYNEAEEMKKYLVEQLNIPADAVFIEPHARHTTTNMRNLNRIIYRFGMPADKPILIVTDENQSKYIVERMEKTALRDLGYVPYQNIKKLSTTETEYYPNKQSLHADSIDPLDP
jgi:hypothetical protein